jgi:transposase
VRARTELVQTARGLAKSYGERRPDRSLGEGEIPASGAAAAEGVGTLIALTFLLTLEDPHCFRKSRDVGCYLGLQPGRRKSGQSDPQMHISKEGDPYLRTNGKKRDIVATARKLAVVLHHLWVSGEV